jgi:hypothetical protein
MARLRTLFHEDNAMTHTREIQTPWVRHAPTWECTDKAKNHGWQPDPVHVSTCLMCLWQLSHWCLSGFYFNLSVSVFCVPSPRRTSGVRSIPRIGAKDYAVSPVLWGKTVWQTLRSVFIRASQAMVKKTQLCTERECKLWHRHGSSLVVTRTVRKCTHHIIITQSSQLTQMLRLPGFHAC